MRICRLLTLILPVFLTATTLLAADPADNWPHWRGPNLDGSSATAKNLPIRWSETENVVWRTALPSWAAATPVIWNDIVFVTSAEEGFVVSKSPGRLEQALNYVKQALNAYDDLLLLALNRKDGSVRWQQTIGEGNEILNKQNMASPTPVTDGNHVWVITGTGVLTCFDFAGKQIWQRNVQQDHGAFGLAFGYASSPLLDEGRLYVQVLHGMKTDDPSYLVGIDASTGKTLWRVERPTDAVHESPDSYSSPMLAEVGGKKQLIVAGGDYLTGHDLETGKELWRVGGLNPQKARNYRTIASSLVVGDVVFAPSRRKPFIAFRAGGSGDAPEVERLWSTDYGPDVPTPVSDGERLFIIDDKGIALCLRVSDGGEVWGRSRLEPGTYSASPVLADGKIYATSEDGATTVIEAGDEFRTLSVNKLNDYTLASPAVSGEQIFVRTSSYLYCLGKKAGTSD
jgi:outer membrane protein assembly factor BamB